MEWYPSKTEKKVVSILVITVLSIVMGLAGFGLFVLAAIIGMWIGG